MAQRLYTNEITDHILSLINTNLKTPLGLKIIQKGGLNLIIDDSSILKNFLPAIFLDVKIDIKDVLLLESYEMNYLCRLVYVNGFEPSTEFIKNKYTETEKIGEMIIDNIQLSGITLPANGGVISCLLSSIDYSPEEEKALASIRSDIYASAIDFIVQVQTQK